MSKEKVSPMRWVIRILIILLFCIALIVGFMRLMEYNELREQKKELEEQKEKLEQAADE